MASPRRLGVPGFYVYPTQYRVAPEKLLLLDEEETGFEGAGLQGWSQSTGGSGSISQVSSPVKYGSYAVRIRSPAISDYAYISRASYLAAAGIVDVEAYAYVVDYFGTTSNHYQYLGFYSASGSRYVLAIFMVATGWYFHHMGEASSSVFSPPAKNAWHRIVMEHDYSSKLGRFLFDDVLIWEHVSSANSAPTVMYVGDGSISTMAGDFYYDCIRWGRKI